MKLALHRIAFIINPASGTNNKIDFGAKIFEYFKAKEIETTIEYTQKAGDAIKLARQFVSEHYDAIIAVGGDGTINEVVNGIGKSGVPMGIVPSGSGNGLARHLGISMRFKNALSTIANAYYQPIDVLKINGKLAINVSGVGFDALVAHKFQKLDKRGLVSYVRIILTEFATFTAQSYSINVDGEEIQRDAYLISFANSSQFGNNAFISPKASISDGYFDLCIVKPFPKISSPIIIEKLMTGTLDKGKYLEIIKAKKVILRQNSKIYHIDGDAVEGAKELKVKILPSMLNMIIPKNQLNTI